MPGEKIAVVARDPLFRCGIATALSREARFALCCEAGSVAGLPACLENCRSRVAILDCGTRGGGGDIAALRRRMPGAKVLALVDLENVEGTIDALAHGADAVVSRGVDGAGLVKGTGAVLDVGHYLCPDIADALGTEAPRRLKRRRIQTRRADLSDRETEVLDMVCRGMTNKEIAAGLSLSVRTVKNHVSHLMKKLGVRSRLEATLVALS